MSAPTPDFDQLLSDHLDGRLGSSDAQMLQQILRDEPALQSQFDALVADRGLLRSLFAAPSPSDATLPPDFASRVLHETRRRRLNDAATASGKEADAQHPTELPTAARELDRSRIVIAIVATAAAFLITATLSMRGGSVAENTQSLAQNLPILAESLSRPDLDPMPIEMPSSVQPMTPMIAATEIQAETPSLDHVTSSEMPAATLRQNPAAVSIGDERPLMNASSLSGAVMVYDVRMSPKGRATGALGMAMKRLGLDDGNRLPINRDVLDAARQANQFDEQESFQIVFVQAPAKKIDRLFLTLLKDSDAVHSVGLSLVTDTPILDMANQLVHADATQIKHDQPLSLDLGGEQDSELSALRALLGEQAFLPLDASSMSEPVDEADAFSSSGNDVITRVLILIR